VHAILHAHLIPKCPHANLFNKRGRDWLTRQPVPEDKPAALPRHIRELDRLWEYLANSTATSPKTPWTTKPSCAS